MSPAGFQFSADVTDVNVERPLIGSRIALVQNCGQVVSRNNSASGPHQEFEYIELNPGDLDRLAGELDFAGNRVQRQAP
jgi:hypothetical protein